MRTLRFNADGCGSNERGPQPRQSVAADICEVSETEVEHQHLAYFRSGSPADTEAPSVVGLLDPRNRTSRRLAHGHLFNFSQGAESPWLLPCSNQLSRLQSSFATAFLARSRIEFAAGLNRLHHRREAGAAASVASNLRFPRGRPEIFETGFHTNTPD